MDTKLPEGFAEKALELTRLILAFGLTNRATHHEDGVMLESDTDHTVMLGVMGTAFAARFAPHLDLGKIAQFALVHDLVEVYAGDVPTFGALSAEAAREKEENERAALARIKEEYGETLPWIHETLEEYESLASSEARFVKVIDKVLPKLVHVINKGVSARAMGHTHASADEFHKYQYAKIASAYGSDQPEAMEFLALSMKLHLAMVPYDTPYDAQSEDVREQEAGVA